MSSKYPVDQVLADANKIINTWSNHADLTLGDVSLQSFTDAKNALEAAIAAVDIKRTELTGLLNARDDRGLALQELVTRARSGFRAAFGPDSSQYDQVGGTRKSERKRPTRRATAPTVAVAAG